jgi:hypothetical protein
MLSDTEKCWRCFHCDELFTDPKAAANHFGVDHLGSEALCQMAQVDGGIAKVIADLAEELQRYRVEDNESYRQFYALGADHRAALIKEEQEGYERGLADARVDGWRQWSDVPRDGKWIIALCNDHSQIYRIYAVEGQPDLWTTGNKTFGGCLQTYGEGLFCAGGCWIPDPDNERTPRENKQ